MSSSWAHGRVILAGAALCSVLFGSGCNRRRATEDECRAIFDRIVDIELEERGYRDPMLAERRKTELRRQFDDRVRACVGRPIPDDAMGCVARAGTAESLSHECLR